MGFFNSCVLVGHSVLGMSGTFVSGTVRSGCSFSNLGGSIGGASNFRSSLL